MNKYIVMILALCLLSVTAYADPAGPNTAILQKALPSAKVTASQPTPIKGLYQVTIGGEFYYLSQDGRFFIQGDVIDLAAGPTNLTENARATNRKDALAKVPEQEMIVFKPEKKAKHVVTVFTDIDCGYCRKMHNQMADYHAKGIEVRYLLFPRAGLGSKSFDKAVSAWCAEDPQQRLTQAKQGQAIPKQVCDNPVDRQYALGKDLGVQGTPTIVLENGSMIPGYLPADQLLKMLESNAS